MLGYKIMEPATIIIGIIIIDVLIKVAPEIGMASAALAGIAFFFPSILMGVLAIAAIVGLGMFMAGG